MGSIARLFTLKWFLVILPLLTTQPSLAFEESFGSIGEGASGTRVTMNNVTFSYEAKVSVKSLLGEPVVAASFRWLLDPRASGVELRVLDGDRLETRPIPVSELGEEAAKQLGIYNVTLRLVVRAGNKQYVMFIDAGAIANGDGKSWSYNVAGSPNYDKFLLNSFATEDAPNLYVSAEEAQSAMKQGLEPVSLSVHSFSVSSQKLVRWYENNSRERRIPGRISLLRRLSESVERNFGYAVDVNAMLDSAEQAGLATTGDRLARYQAHFDKLTEYIDKLKDVPERFRQGGNNKAYEEEVADIEQEIEKQDAAQPASVNKTDEQPRPTASNPAPAASGEGEGYVLHHAYVRTYRTSEEIPDFQVGGDCPPPYPRNSNGPMRKVKCVVREVYPVWSIHSLCHHNTKKVTRVAHDSRGLVVSYIPENRFVGKDLKRWGEAEVPDYGRSESGFVGLYDQMFARIQDGIQGKVMETWGDERQFPTKWKDLVKFRAAMRAVNCTRDDYDQFNRKVNLN
ncbi:hypothetical protein GCM10011316_25010 [Roseibium aquae]|uniref:Uncharacterized protein n=1 Tax=Roseibium aquae TaxID=1323746 RepID=A0A916X193_9HYPH|nr:hypothetical protein [Roseibium aquae]GGB52012.1 hypothetical protein GCM10011316_25010 [Roseibium aquae]